MEHFWNVVQGDDGIVTGFKLHFSNGSYASYSRGPDGSRPMNIRPDTDGAISFMIGDIEKLEKIWKIDGKPVKDWDAING